MSEKIIFILAEAPVLGLITPISLLSSYNINRAMDSLENGDCDKIYIALDHLEAEEKEKACEYISNLRPELQFETHVSASNKSSFGRMFAKWLIGFSGKAVKLQIMCNPGMKKHILSQIGHEMGLIRMEEKTKCTFGKSVTVISRGELFPAIYDY